MGVPATVSTLETAFRVSFRACSRTTGWMALLHTLVGMRPTLYLTTLRGSAAVKADMGSALDGEVFVESVSTRQTMDNELLKQMTNPLEEAADKHVYREVLNELEYQLTIPKNRGGTPVLEETTIVIDSDVWIDESRAI